MDFLNEHPYISFFLGMVVLLVVIILIKRAYDNWADSAESAAIKTEVEQFRTEILGKKKTPEEELTDSDETALELREYCTISKRQAKSTFSSAMLACYVGFAMFGLAVVIALFSDSETSTGSQYSAIGGAVVEVIAGLFFWMYTKANEQMKSYYDTLLETYRYQSSIELADELDDSKKDEAYAFIISQMCGGSENSSLQFNTTADNAK